MNFSAVIIGYVWPEPNSSAAGQNMLSIIKSMCSAGHKVTFLTAATDSEHKTDLESLGVDSREIALNCSSFDSLIEDLAPDIVVFDRYMTEEQFSWRVKASCPNALRVLNTEDLHSLRQARHNAVKMHGDAKLADLNTELAQREIAAILRSDITLVISKHEMQLLTEHYQVPRSQLFYYPLPTDKSVPESPSFTERAHFVHIGNFRHAPNWDAVLQLKQFIWPAIRQALPDAQLHIYGAYPPKKATQLHNEKQGFIVKGWAKSVDDVMQNARVLLAPLRFGAGVKGKFLDAMRFATPSITTWIGAEGIADDDSWPGAICSADIDQAKTIDEFAKHAVALYNNEEIWTAASQKAVECVALFSQQKDALPLEPYLTNVIESIAQHRQDLFLQSLLWHQTLTASKYMSQWIEAKNKKP
ncbi:glycosyltransferase family 4 protein [Alteromonas sp. McT4-15]|nr:glycosyltransferase family 4 protein [Alteromonas sp. McT4-15]MCB4436555.1 glycosyltransferase family 4 protein [Alteromonas sp. McT4-15]